MDDLTYFKEQAIKNAKKVEYWRERFFKLYRETFPDWIEVNKPWKFQTNSQEHQDLLFSWYKKGKEWEENPFPGEERGNEAENLLLDEIDKNDEKASFTYSFECRAGMLIEVKHADGLVKFYIIGDIDKYGNGTERDIENEDVVLRVIDLVRGTI